MKHFVRDSVNLSTVPLFDRKAVQKIEILMVTICEQGCIRFPGIVIQNILIMRSAVLDSAEISRDQQIIILCQRSQSLFQCYFVDIVESVCITCNADHIYLLIYYTEQRE